MNLDLMLDYGAESWKQYNEVLQDMLNRIQVKMHPNHPIYIQKCCFVEEINHSLGQAQLAEVKKAIQEVNWSRKNQQTQVPKNFLILFI